MRTSTIPEERLEGFLGRIETADRLARSDQVEQGHAVLVAGFSWAAEAFIRGESWGADLVARYLDAWEEYCKVFGVKPA
jgi:hypothetical protein